MLVLLVGFWLVRLALEFLLPVSVPLLGAHTTAILKALILVGLATVAIPLVELGRLGARGAPSQGTHNQGTPYR